MVRVAPVAGLITRAARSAPDPPTVSSVRTDPAAVSSQRGVEFRRLLQAWAPVATLKACTTPSLLRATRSLPATTTQPESHGVASPLLSDACHCCWPVAALSANTLSSEMANTSVAPATTMGAPEFDVASAGLDHTTRWAMGST